MSFETPNQNNSSRQEKTNKTEGIERKGLTIKALAAITNGVFSSALGRAEANGQKGFFIAALEKATETRKTLDAFDPEGDISDFVEKGLARGYEKIAKHFKSNQTEEGP